MKSNLLPLAKEGWNYILISFAFFILFYLFHLTLLTLLTFFIILFFIYSFRNPERELVSFSDGSILSPTDGVVSSIEELEDDALYAYKIEIDSNCLDVGILRAPMDAMLVSVRKYNGSRVSDESSLYEDLNEYTQLVFTDDTNSLKVVHRLKRSFAPLCVNIKEATTLKQSSRYGFMINGTTSIYLPDNFRINLKIGDKLRASESLIGYFSKG